MQISVDPYWKDFAKRSLQVFLFGSTAVMLVCLIVHPIPLPPLAGRAALFALPVLALPTAFDPVTGPIVLSTVGLLAIFPLVVVLVSLVDLAMLAWSLLYSLSRRSLALTAPIVVAPNQSSPDARGRRACDTSD
jgi:hypothetical protein